MRIDIKKVLERLLLKGSIVVRKPMDWERYKDFKATMHEAAFELIEIPHVAIRQKLGGHPQWCGCAGPVLQPNRHVDTFVHHQRRPPTSRRGVQAAREQ